MKKLLHLSLLICSSLTCLAQADLNLEAYQAYVEELTKIRDTVTLRSTLIPPTKLLEDREPCGHKEYNPAAFDTEKQSIFENKLQQFVTEQRKKMAARGLDRVQIPVVVHVIHQGSSIGVGENISEAQIMSQIQALNDAFNRTSQTRYSGLENNAGLNYNTLTAASEIEFVPASIDPQGNPSNGINRVEVLKGYHLIPDFIDEIIKPATIWNPDYYLNFWSTRLFDGVKPGLLGYAVFPTLSGLPGIDFSANPSSDGIVCDYRTVGSNEYGDNFELDPSYQFGVVAVHEVGHFLGLRHVWGDGDSPDVGCSVDDFVDDTPNAAFRSLSCETNESCGSVDLNENYMDYGSDLCKNVFTNGQILRMRTVLSVSPRRASLISSPVLQGLPIPVSIQPPNDLCAQALPIACGQTYFGNTNNSTPTGVFTGLDGRLCSGTPATSGIWYSFQGNGQQIHLQTSGPSTIYDASIHVFSGDCTDLICIGGNDDGTSLFSNTGSDLAFLSDVGQTYFVYVSGRRGETGDFELKVNCNNYNTAGTPPNDRYTEPQEINCGDLIEGNTSNATLDAISSGSCGIELTDPGVWYQYNGTGELVTVNTCTNLQFDTKIAIFSGTESFLDCRAQNDNGGCDLGSERKFIGTEGTSYLIWVGGTQTGSFSISLTCGPLPEAPVNLILSKQSQVDSFAILYPATTEILGDVIIQHDLDKNTIIGNLLPLQNIKSIGGNLIIEDNIYDPFENLDGLDSLTQVGGNLVISGNPALKSIDALQSIKTIGGDCQVSGFSIASFHGFSNLEKVGGSIVLNGSRINRGQIKNLEAFDQVSSLGGDLIIQGYRTMDTLQGFAGIQEIPGDLIIEGNWSLVSETGLLQLGGFDQLEKIAGDLTIFNNRGLTRIEQYPNLARVGGTMYCGFNEALTELNTFNNLEVLGRDFSARFLGISRLEGFNSLDSIHGKVLLRFLDVGDLSAFDQLKYVGDSLIINSALNADSVTNVFKNLDYVGKTVFFDFNLDVPHFSGLNSLKTIGEDLVILKFSQAETVNAFNNLQRIEGSLTIADNIFTERIGMFSSLKSIGGDLSLIDNSNLIEVGPFSNLTNIGGKLEMHTNRSLTNIMMPALQQLEGDLQIGKSNGISSLSAPVLENIGGDFTIDRFNFDLDTFYLASLLSIEGSFVFDSSQITRLLGVDNLSEIGVDFIPSTSLFNFDDLSISSIGRDLVLDTLRFIRSLDGLSQIEEVGRDLRITRLPRLTNLDGLSNLHSVGGAIILLDNDTLSDCSGLCNVLSQHDSTMVQLSGNKSGCNNVSVLLDFCLATPTNEHHFSREVNIYPNPFEHSLTIGAHDVPINQVVVHDLRGSVIFQKSADFALSGQIDLTNVVPGIYVIKVQFSDGHYEVRKIQKK